MLKDGKKLCAQSVGPSGFAPDTRSGAVPNSNPHPLVIFQPPNVGLILTYEAQMMQTTRGRVLRSEAGIRASAEAPLCHPQKFSYGPTFTGRKTTSKCGPQTGNISGPRGPQVADLSPSHLLWSRRLIVFTRGRRLQTPPIMLAETD